MSPKSSTAVPPPNCGYLAAIARWEGEEAAAEADRGKTLTRPNMITGQ